jgi:hypothetical protein
MVHKQHLWLRQLSYLFLEVTFGSTKVIIARPHLTQRRPFGLPVLPPYVTHSPPESVHSVQVNIGSTKSIMTSKSERAINSLLSDYSNPIPSDLLLLILLTELSNLFKFPGFDEPHNTAVIRPIDSRNPPQRAAFLPSSPPKTMDHRNSPSIIPSRHHTCFTPA